MSPGDNHTAAGWRELLGRAQIACREGDLKAAELYYIQALDRAEHLDGREDISVAVVLLELAEFYADNGQTERAQFIWDKVRDALASSLEHITGWHEVGTAGSV